MRRETPVMFLLLSLPVLLLGTGRDNLEKFDVGCVCGPQCDCRTDAADVPSDPIGAQPASPSDAPEVEYQTEPEQPKAPAASSVPVIGSRKVINGVEQEVYRITERGGMKTYYYRPVGSDSGNTQAQANEDCADGTCNTPSRPRLFRW